MNAKLITVCLPEQLYKSNDEVVKLFGSTGGKERKLFTSEIKNKLAEELVKNVEKQKKLFKQAGL